VALLINQNEVGYASANLWSQLPNVGKRTNGGCLWGRHPS